MLCGSLGEKAKPWGQVEHPQLCKTSKGSALTCVFVWGKSWSLHMVTAVRHKQTRGSKQGHGCAAFPTTNWRESVRKKNTVMRYSIVTPFIRNTWSWFYSSYCTFCQKSTALMREKKPQSIQKLKARQQRFARGHFVLREVKDLTVTFRSNCASLLVFPSEEIHLNSYKICF